MVVVFKLKNQSGQTPFAIALMRKNNKATSAILKKEPNAAEQFDNKGRNFLHLAVDKNAAIFLVNKKLKKVKFFHTFRLVTRESNLKAEWDSHKINRENCLVINFTHYVEIWSQ